nr:MAG TPA: restriction enzyme [Caudoviricetes sp.]
MRASRGEIKIEDILRFNGLSFMEEYSFDDLLSFNHRPLRFDFAVFDDNGDLDFLIEYQGIQHYEPKSKFGGLAGLRKQ